MCFSLRFFVRLFYIPCSSLNFLLIMYFDIQAGSHDCFSVMYVIFIFSSSYTVIICDMRVNKVMFSSVQFNMD